MGQVALGHRPQVMRYKLRVCGLLVSEPAHRPSFHPTLDMALDRARY